MVQERGVKRFTRADTMFGEIVFLEFPLSMENIPRQKSFACLSLKFGCVISALVVILYSVLSLAQCTALISDLAPHVRTDDLEVMITFGLLITVTIVHTVTFCVTAVMLVGALREKPSLIRPWVVWTSLQVMVYVLLFIFYTTMSIVNQAEGSLLLYVSEFLSILLRFYMLMVVASFYKQLEEEMYDGERYRQLVERNIEQIETKRNGYATWA